MKSNFKILETLFMLGIMFFLFSGLDGCDNGNDLTGDPVRGGLLYDKWWKVNNGTEPTDDHPLYPASGEKEGSDTWRCKECHGWDYKGVNGAYASGSHFTGIDGIFDDKDESESELTNAFSSGGIMDFSDHFSDQDIADIVAFMQNGLIDMSTYIDLSTKEVSGDAVNGEALYSGSGLCSTCHGTDGKLIDFGDGKGVSEVTLDNPWETLHKIRFGHPGSVPEMSSAIEIGLSVQDQVDILAFSVSSLGAELTATGQ